MCVHKITQHMSQYSTTTGGSFNQWILWAPARECLASRVRAKVYRDMVRMQAASEHKGTLFYRDNYTRPVGQSVVTLPSH